MQFAIVANQPVQAGKDAPLIGRCLYCDEWVDLRSDALNITGYLWLHQTNGDAQQCARLRAIAQRELDEALCIK